MIRSTMNIHLTRVNTVDVHTNVLDSSGVCTVTIEDVTLFFANKDEAVQVMASVVEWLRLTDRNQSWYETIELEDKGEDDE